MNIAITSLYLPGGSKIGVGYQVHALANALVQRGHAVTVFSACPAGDGASYQSVLLTPTRRHFRTFAFALDLRKIDFNGFDVLNAHGDDWFLWNIRRPRHVHTFHGSCLAEAIHSPTWAGRARMAALAVCETQTVLLADDTTTVSENTRRFIPGIRHVIPCGVDTEAFHPGEKSATPTILFVGTMHGRKRGQLLLDLFRREILPKIPGAQLWCVCDTPDGETDCNAVRWLGRVQHETLTELFRTAWVFCLPSSYEGFGVPYIEAMASGTAVVATRNVGAIEVTGNGRWGRVVGDAELAGAIIELISNHAVRRTLEASGLERSKDYAWAAVCRLYEMVYWGAI